MREILFRGKRVDNGEWVEGCYSHEKVGDYFTAVFITEPLTDGVFARHRVDPSTVGLIPPPPVSARTATQILIFLMSRSLETSTTTPNC